jgi:hypothetical protein
MILQTIAFGKSESKIIDQIIGRQVRGSLRQKRFRLRAEIQ